MGIFIDIIIIITMLLFIFIGYRKGLIKVAISFLAFIIAIIVALILYRPIAKQIMANTEIDEKINETIYSNIKDIDFQNISEDEKNNNGIIKIAENYITEGLEKSKENTAEFVADSLTTTLVEGITFICLIIALRIALIALRIGLIVLNLLADIIGNLPIIKQFNKSGGILYGIVEGFLIINCILAVLYILNPICQNGEIQRNIEKSKIGKMIYENNFIINTVAK